MPSTTDVRAWLRENDYNPPQRGNLPRALTEIYDAAHPGTVPGEVIESADESMGVTEADFPPEDDYPPVDDRGQVQLELPDVAAQAGQRQRPAPKSGERRPRTVRPGRGLRARFFGGRADKGKGKGKTKTRIAAGPRTSLSDWAEETWSDLAWLAAPIPPLAKMLELQAPYAGAVFDAQVRGTPVDAVLQPVARYSGAFRALNGLVGPPVYVGMICMTGARVQVHHPDGTPALNPDGTPVTDFDGRTKLMFQGLRYSLLQMAKVSELQEEQIQARTEAMVARTRVVDRIIADLFGLPMPADPEDVPAAPGAPPPGAAGTQNGQNGFAYPAAPTMSNVGADPGRM